MLTNSVYYVYDGMTVLQERDSNNIPQVTYTRGTDLSGKLQKVGGIGGLLARTDNGGSAYYHSDGNGNITTLINNRGTVVARYLYDPFGNLLAKSGPLAQANLYRFSSKELHPNSGTHYYGYRFYEPNLQRWLNRDPIMELGGVNMHAFVGNRPMHAVDEFGLTWVISARPLFPGQEDQYGPYAHHVDDGSDGFMVPSDPEALVYEATHQGLQDDPVMDMLLSGVGIPPEGSLGSLLGSGGKTSFRAGVKCFAKEAENAAESAIQKALKMGKAGKNSGVRTLKTDAEVRRAFEELSKGGKVVTPPDYKGVMVELEDGTRIGLRESSKSGGGTIDLKNGAKSAKIHIE